MLCRNPWEGVNLLPFIDIRLLKDTIAAHCPSSKLSVDERKRNAMGKVYFYRYDPTCTDIVESPSKNIGLPDIVASHSSVSTHLENLGLSHLVFEPKLIVGTQIPYPGFPSLNVLPIASVELASVGLNCFGFPSKYPNMILTMHQMPELPPIEQLAGNVIGKSLFVNWPMMHEGRVVAISDWTKEVRMVNGILQTKEHSKLAADRWLQESDLISQSYHVGNGVPGSGGIQIGEIKIRLKLLPLQGMKTDPSNGSTKKIFGKEEADVPLQLALWHAPAPDPRFIERGPMTLHDRFAEGCNVVLTKGKFRGCLGTVVGIADQKNVGVKVMTVPPEMPFGLAIARSVQESFVSSVDAARILKLNPGVFGKIMGRLQFEQGRYDLGLNLKSGDGLCVVGYTRKKVEEKKGNQHSKNGKDDSAWSAGDSVLVVGSRALADDDEKDERIQWEYTPKAIRLVELFRSKFPQLFAAINKRPNERRYDANQVFGPNGEAWLPVVRDWLDKHESAKLPRSPVTTESMSYEATAAVQKAADVRSLALTKKGYPKECLIKVPGSALYREGSTGATDVLLPSDLNDSERPELGDRIVNLCADGVPFGARGTVIGIHEAATSGSVELVMDEEFIGGTSLQGHCANFRGKLCNWSHLLKIAPDNSKGLVDKLVPNGAKQAAMNQAVDTILSSAGAESPEHSKKSWDSQVDAAVEVAKNASATPHRTAPADNRAKSKTPTRSSSRAGSTGRNRQAAWREARGPEDNGIGFKGANRGGTSGLTRWKNAIKSKPLSGRNATSLVDQTAADLKKMLGLSSPSSASPAVPTTPSSDQLKAMLGVVTANANSAVQEAPGSAPAASARSANASDGLKALLGVSPAPPPPVQVQQRPAPPPPVQIQQRPAPPSTAAEKLLQLMAGKQQPHFPPSYAQGPSAPTVPSPFNFTYVEEGKEQPPPSAPMSHHQPLYPNYHMPPPVRMPNMMYPMASYYGSPPPPPHPNFGGYGPPPPPPPPQMTGPPVDEFPPLNGDFPALGAPPGQAPKSASNKANANELKPARIMVPSVVKGRR